jgi:hypothetical protein
MGSRDNNASRIFDHRTCGEPQTRASFTMNVAPTMRLPRNDAGEASRQLCFRGYYTVW